ncbi:MAG: AraC family transcriptional regulator [Oleiphilaceae bacterium]|nr:AraC family transcriptional regulator [Oleiphilaceae bacterium]
MTRGNRLGDIDVLYVAVMARALRLAGTDPAPLLQRFRLSPALLATPGARISIPRFMRLGHEAMVITGDPALGLSFGLHTRLTDMGLAGMAAQCAPTLGEALVTLIRYERLTSYNSRGHSDTRWLDNGDLEARFYSISPYNRYNAFVVDAILAGWLQFLRQLKDSLPHAMAPAASPLLQQVRIEYPQPLHSQRLESHFRCPVQFSAADNTLVVRAEVAGAGNPLAQPAMYRDLLQRCQRELTTLEAGLSVVERVRDALTPRLRGQPDSMDRVAAALGTTAWGLRRELAAQGLTYRQLVDKIRSELGLDYVRETRLSFAEIGYLLGFANATGFYRAFRRWTGENPGDFRARVAARR